MRQCGADRRCRAVTGGEAPGAAGDTGFEPRSAFRGRVARVSLTPRYERVFQSRETGRLILGIRVFQRNGMAMEPGKTLPWMRNCLRAGPSKR